MRVLPFAALILLGGCVSVPDGPSMLVLPGSGKNFGQFRTDDVECRQFASGQVGGTSPSQVAGDSGVKSAAVGTLIGAAAGAAIDGRHGAATGAGAGLLIGALAGAGAGESSAYNLQQRYDFAYQQCMYAKGNRVPVSGRMTYSSPSTNYPPSPPPPPGPPPPPPPAQ
jgi:hypothetical protein